MDQVQYAQETDSFAAKQRFESFRLGGQPSPATNTTFSHHGRSHSRGSSISSSLSNFSMSTSSSSLRSSTSTDMSSLASSSSANSISSSAKRNSHHRRRSSVSTRRESADMMGVTVPDLPTSTSDDNVNLGDKDSIRRRALWALEGKPDVAFNKVEIPELSTPDIEKRIFDFGSKPSFSSGPATGPFAGGMISKRDSFKLLASSSSSKDQLHTLIEEEEEEEEEAQSHPATAVPIVVALTKPSPARPRPATLTLRPLALTPAQNPASLGGLPTPTLTPSPRSGLKSLSLAASHTDDTPTNQFKRATRGSGPASRASITAFTDSPTSTSSCESQASRRSSISYRRSASPGLPTPDMDRRFSGDTSSDEEGPRPRPLSASEQHFLFKSHNALLTRITDLERALSSRSRSRPTSCASDASSASDTRSTFSEPTDEMLQLIADLKAERDELNRDTDGWRQRVADLDKQVVLLSNRVDSERRDAWVARSRVGLAEAEKAALEKAFETKRQEALDAKSECERLNSECNRLTERMKHMDSDVQKSHLFEAECITLRVQLADEQKARQALQSELNAVKRGPFKASSFTFPRNRGFTSVDSQSSATDVECESPVEFALKSVVEEVEEDDESEDDNGLDGYEDQEDSDENYGSSIGSEQDFTETIGMYPPILHERPSHVSRASLSKTWTFPKSVSANAQSVQTPETDRFFGCLDDVDESPSMDSVPRSYESSKELFAMGFQHGSQYFAEEDDMPPFFLPDDIATFVEAEHVPRSLDVVMEEDEDEEEEQEQEEDDSDTEVVADVTFTVSGPEEEVTPPKAVSSFQFMDNDEADEVPFNFGRPVLMTPPASVPRATPGVAASFIPRAVSRSPSPASTTSPSKSPVLPPSYNAFITPPTKRGGIMPSFLPTASPSPTPVKSKVPSPTFIRHPQRKPVLLVHEDSVLPSTSKSSSLKPSNMNIGVHRSSADAPPSTQVRTRPSSLMMSVDLSANDGTGVDSPGSTSTFSSIMTSPLSARLSFQSFNNLIPTSFMSPRGSIDEGSHQELNRCPRPSIIDTKGTTFDKQSRNRFVSKEQQLERLRTRMRQERDMAGISTVDVCLPCTGAAVFL